MCPVKVWGETSSACSSRTLSTREGLPWWGGTGGRGLPCVGGTGGESPGVPDPAGRELALLQVKVLYCSRVRLEGTRSLQPSVRHTVLVKDLFCDKWSKDRSGNDVGLEDAFSLACGCSF